MFRVLGNSDNALNATIQVLSSHKSLFRIPLWSAMSGFLLLFIFASPFLLRPSGHSLTSKAHWDVVEARIFLPEADPQRRSHPQHFHHLTRPAEILSSTCYLLTMVLVTFLNVAFMYQILAAFRGETVSAGDALRFAITKWRAILLWSLFAGVIGWLIQEVEQRFSLAGKWIANVVDASWSAAIVFVMPVIVLGNDTNPIKNLRSSAKAIRKTWGELVIGFVGLEAGALLLGFLLVFSLLSLGMVSALLGGVPPMFLTITICVFGLLAGCYIVSVISMVYQCALYLYATTGQLPSPYPPALVTQAWKMKKAEL